MNVPARITALRKETPTVKSFEAKVPTPSPYTLIEDVRITGTGNEAGRNSR